ncbi:IS30 family transposase [Enterovibrio makurazakiensis]|uniref:IS30 family transposase n=1 Tax=Enterovibrio makurazakiensis TaxID=2910232 RepID=UPI003D1BDA1B
MNYQQITENERYMLSVLRKQGCTVASIAKLLGRHRSTIYREVQRNACWVTDGAYRPSKAQRRTVARRRRSRRNTQMTEAIYALVRHYLRLDWSPEQIVGHLNRKGLHYISHESIYQYIWRDKAKGGLLWQHLRCAPKQRRKRYSAYDSRGRIAAKKHISERPHDVENRNSQGHWEIDTVMGKGSLHCLVTLVERKTGYTVIGHLNNKTTRELNRRVIMMLKSHLVKTITADNGTEFHQYSVLEAALKTTFYFATPYHSWERGTNENTNGLIRQYFPKGTSLELVTQAECNQVAKKLNTRPRKRLAFKTPEECYVPKSE